jgi:hypothetical protein
LPFATQVNANVMDQSDYELSPWVPVGFVAGFAQSRQLNKVWRQSSFVVASLMALIPKILDEDTFDDGNRPNTSDQIERLLGYTARLYAEVQEAPLDGRVYGRQSCPPCEYPAGTAGWTAVPPEAPGDTWYVRTAGQWGNLLDILLGWEFIQDVQGTSWYARTHGQWGDLPNWLLPAWGYFTDAPPGSWFVRSQGQWADINNFGFLTDAPWDGRTWGRRNGAWQPVPEEAPAGTWNLRTAGAWTDINNFGFATEAWVLGLLGGGDGLTSEYVWATTWEMPPPVGDMDWGGNHPPMGRFCGWAKLEQGQGMQFMGGVPSNWPSMPYPANGLAPPTWPPYRYIYKAADPMVPATTAHWVEIYPDGSWQIWSGSNGWGGPVAGGGAGVANNYGPFAPGLGSNDPYPPWNGQTPLITVY